MNLVHILKVSLQYSHPTNEPYPEPNESCSHSQALFL